MRDASLIWWLIPIAIIINALFFCLQYLAERQDVAYGRLPRRHSTINDTNQTFLYLEDSLIQPLGNLFSLSFIWIVFIHIVFLGLASALELLICILISALAAFLFYKLGTSLIHKPNWRYPQIGKISFGGQVSLIYFGLQVLVVILTTYKTVVEEVDGIFLVAYVIGLSTWLMVFLADYLGGRFDKREIIARSGVKS